MTEPPELIDLRKALATAAPSAPDAKKKQAEDAVEQILDAIEQGVLHLGNWELRCLSAALHLAQGGDYDTARTIARKAIWPRENRRDAEVARYRIGHDMLTLDGLRRALASLRTSPAR